MDVKTLILRACLGACLSSGLGAGLTGCIFDDDPAAPRPRTTFDFSRLDSLANPLSRWYAVGKESDLVGVKFAFTSVEYQHQVDSNIAAFAAGIGRPPAIAGAYFDLSSQPKNLKTFLDAVGGNACIPFVTLDPKDWDEPDLAFQRTFLARITAGDFDDTLRALAATLRDFGKPVLFRFAHEMNGDWYPYSGGFTGGGADADKDGAADGPQRYVAAWRHAHDLFTAVGASNLVWVYCPNAESFPKAEWNRPFSYYPGAAYVDFVAVDAYESPDKAKRSMEDLLSDFLNEMGLHYQGSVSGTDGALKPFGLGEFGTYRRDAGSKAEWYAAALAYIAGSGHFRFNVLYNARNYDKDFSIAGSDSRIRAAYADDRLTFGPVERTP
jgi:hypothetical protein